MRDAMGKQGRAVLGLDGDGKLHVDAVPQDLRGVALAVAVQEGGEQAFDAAEKHFRASQDAVVRGQLLGAWAARAIRHWPSVHGRWCSSRACCVATRSSPWSAARPDDDRAASGAAPVAGYALHRTAEARWPPRARHSSACIRPACAATGEADALQAKLRRAHEDDRRRPAGTQADGRSDPPVRRAGAGAQGPAAAGRRQGRCSQRRTGQAASGSSMGLLPASG